MKAVGRRAEPRLAVACTAARRWSRPRCRTRRTSRACSTPTTTATGWRSPSRPSTGARRAIPGSRASSSHGHRRASSPCTTSSPRARRRRWSRWPTTPASSSAAGRSWPRWRAPGGARRVGAAPPGPAGRAGVGLAGGLRGPDARPRRRALRQRAAHRRRRRLRGLAPRRRREPGLRRGRLGALGRARGRAAARGAAGPPRAPASASTPTSSPSSSPPSAGSSCRTRSRPPPPGLPTLRPFQAAQGEVALAWLRRRTGW